MLSCLFIAASRSLAWKGLTSWLSCVGCFIVFFVNCLTFACGVLDQVLYLTVSNHDLCLLTYFYDFMITYYIIQNLITGMHGRHDVYLRHAYTCIISLLVNYVAFE